ncbi:glycerophosphoryl diester phosphodiesterase [Chitinophaga sp. YR627]|uniref:glycerophosphodiester phosphodiesterase family protein n=1 Tax=Chitinophaga sp. YR627 TaxID=1881041 RepID=UPI0008DF2DC9|nr:glycerophosphodiester phosphodiesterase family protein [Chitinophaga sp. YR627]SFN79458.1 glycerophosphoryl diester phosphodiesterase [Chitinophaga sp. YR627]
MKPLQQAMLAAGVLLAATGLNACKSTKPMTAQQQLPTFYKVGHRGTRGLMPENTIPSMIKAIETGANTIEFDVHITKDGQVVVYHDASFNPAYTTMPDGSEIPAASRSEYTFYKMDYSRIREFVIGEKAYPEFPQQQRMKSYAPLLSEMIDSVEAYTQSHKLPGVVYLLEIKSSAKTDGSEQPVPEEYIDKLMAVKNLLPLGKRLIVQSFDPRPLQVLHRRYPDMTLGFLTYDKEVKPAQQLELLGFTPQFYNPFYQFTTPELLSLCHSKKIQVVPWTVQEATEMKKLQEMGADGIISDYPVRFAEAGF